MVHMLESNFELQTSLVRCICWRLHWSHSCFIGGMYFRQLKIIDSKDDCDFWTSNYKKNMFFEHDTDIFAFIICRQISLPIWEFVATEAINIMDKCDMNWAHTQQMVQ